MDIDIYKSEDPKLEEMKKTVQRRKTLLAVIADSYKRMATNTSRIYRAEQLAKCDEWLAELTAMFEKDPVLFNME